jgi:hypothetical protein
VFLEQYVKNMLHVVARDYTPISSERDNNAHFSLSNWLVRIIQQQQYSIIHSSSLLAWMSFRSTISILVFDLISFILVYIYICFTIFEL